MPNESTSSFKDIIDTLSGKEALKVEHIVVIDKENSIRIAVVIIVSILAMAVVGSLFNKKK